MDSDGSLAEYDEKTEISGTVTCLSLSRVPEGHLRSLFLAVGCDDCTVRILSLDPEPTFKSESVQALTAAPSALCTMAMEDSSSSGSILYLHIGLQSGVYLRTVLEEITGELADTRHQFLGIKAVKLFQITVQSQTCVLALSSRPWIGYTNPNTKRFMMTPLSYKDLRWGWSFSSSQCEEGIVGIHANYLRIFSIENLSNSLTQKSLSLTYTPRRLIKHPHQPLFYTIESENNTLAPELRAQLLAHPNEGNGDSKEGESFLIVGTGKDVIPKPRQSSGGYIYVYRFHRDGKDLEFIHKTKVKEPPMALLPFQGRLVAGIGKILRIYDLGIKQLLRKAQADVAPQLIVSLQTQGSRIIVGDVQQGVTMVVYKHESNELIPFVDDTIARWTTSTGMVDYNSVAGGDKFGNVWIVRCPEKASAEADEAGSEAYLISREYLNGAPNRLNLIAHFFTQDIPTSICKTSLIVGGQDVLLWSGLQGTIGVLIPFVAREDADFFQTLEMHMRGEDPPLAGRDHHSYRSYYVPVKGVIDGDLCERYLLLPNDKKQMIASELDRSVREVERKISSG
ncbi:MAG: pre-mRNA-splicing factor rse1 [Claussenomyces sp. TS43310]|nr:MAG: pre-mRNA-splicing factor rse1 [Claussenomyces sp. TS43310]